MYTTSFCSICRTYLWLKVDGHWMRRMRKKSEKWKKFIALTNGVIRRKKEGNAKIFLNLSDVDVSYPLKSMTWDLLTWWYVALIVYLRLIGANIRCICSKFHEIILNLRQACVAEQSQWEVKERKRKIRSVTQALWLVYQVKIQHKYANKSTKNASFYLRDKKLKKSELKR